MTLRKIIFWSHLAVGILVGLFVAYMAATGSILALEPQILRFSEKHMVASDTVGRPDCKTIGQRMAAVQLQLNRPVGSMQIDIDPRIPNRVSFGKQEIVLVHPCTGEVLHGGASTVRSFLVTVRNLHESASLQHERGALYGIKNAANLGFCFLIAGGLILWIPRQWRKANLKAITTWRFRLRGRARDWNLHNVAGFWFAVPLLTITLTGAVMSYSWAEAILYRVSGSPAPPPHDEKHEDSRTQRGQTRVGEASSQSNPSQKRPATAQAVNRLSDTVPQSHQASPPADRYSRPPQAQNTRSKDGAKQQPNDLTTSEEYGKQAEDLRNREDTNKELDDADGHPGVEHTRHRGDHPDGDDDDHQRPGEEHAETSFTKTDQNQAHFTPANSWNAPSRTHVASAPLVETLSIPAAGPMLSATTASIEKTGEAEHPGHEGKHGERKHGGARRSGEHGEGPLRSLTTAELIALDPLFETAKRQKPGWQNIRFRITGNNAQLVSFTFNEGEESEQEGGGRQAELQLDRVTGSILRWTTEEQLSTGQRWRRYARYLHTGQVFGLTGQIIALLSSLATLLLVWTGIALSLRRFRAWISRLKRRGRAKKEADEAASHS